MIGCKSVLNTPMRMLGDDTWYESNCPISFSIVCLYWTVWPQVNSLMLTYFTLSVFVIFFWRQKPKNFIIDESAATICNSCLSLIKINAPKEKLGIR